MLPFDLSKVPEQAQFDLCMSIVKAATAYSETPEGRRKLDEIKARTIASEPVSNS